MGAQLLTGEDLFAVATGWTELADAQREPWGGKARKRAALGEKTSAQAEYMAYRLRIRLRSRINEPKAVG